MTCCRLPLAVRFAGALLVVSLLAAMASPPSLQPAREPLFAARLPRPGTPAAAITFVNITVVPMDTERVLTGQTVVVEHGRITALGPVGKIRIPEGAVQVDGREKVLIPGLADMHAHAAKAVRKVANTSDRLLLREHQLFRWLAHGLTTARLLDHGFAIEPGEDALKLRARAASGEILSPRIYTSGSISGRIPHTRGTALQLHEVAEAVRTYKAAGFDFMKIHPAGSSPAVRDSLVATARRAGIPLVGHTVQPLKRTLETYRSIEHLTGYLWGNPGSPAELNEGMSPDTLAARIQELAAATQRAGIWNCPTLYNDIKNEFSGVGVMAQVIKALQDAGAGLLAGSDRLQDPRFDAELAEAKLTPEQWRLEAMYGYAGATHRELQVLVEKAGLTPYQALATATRNVATYFGTLDSSGTIAVGKRADLVLLEGNPLADIRQTERIAGVMLGGLWLDRAALNRRTAEIGAWLKQWCSSAAGADGERLCPAELKPNP